MYFKGLPSILWLLTFIGVMCGQSILYSGISASSSSQYFLSIGVADMQVTLLNFLAVSSRFLIALLRKLYWFNSRCHSSIPVLVQKQMPLVNTQVHVSVWVVSQ